ncbi:MAG TPA: hypothetical protein VMF50_11815 [Candidatus Binataceae bacterium]|nr:hypothetical protein [Candidatus Binataceae bacterium]
MDQIQGSTAGYRPILLIAEHMAVYFRQQAQHFSNGGFNGENRNYSLNTAGDW